MRSISLTRDSDLEQLQLPVRLSNLSLNKNQLVSLHRVLTSLAQATHNLHYISFIGEDRGTSW